MRETPRTAVTVRVRACGRLRAHVGVCAFFNNKVLTLPSRAHLWGFPGVHSAARVQLYCVRVCARLPRLRVRACVRSCVCHIGKHIFEHHCATPARGCGCL